MSESEPSDPGEVTKVAERPVEERRDAPVLGPPPPPPLPPAPPPLRPRAAGTLLGVAPPKVESTPESPLRKPVFVRSGVSEVDSSDEPLPLPRMALPSRPLIMDPPEGFGDHPGAERGGLLAWLGAMSGLPVRIAGGEVSLWMVLAPALLVVLGLGALVVSALASAASKHPAPIAVASAAPSAAASVVSVKPPPPKPSLSALAKLEGKPASSLSASELLKLADERAENARDAAKALRSKLEENPALAKEKQVQSDLFHAVSDAETAREALAAMAAAEPPLAADLLYEVWTGTTARTDATELARVLVYSTDVRPKASAALSVALDLRSAEKCEEFKAVLPRALKDGDRRALHLLTKLTAKRGCGPKKADDCFACLREPADDLTATVNAVKSRRPPTYMAPQ